MRAHGADVLQEGVTRDGRHAGGRAYGYRAVPGKRGELEIVEEEPEIVRQIFADYIDGKTPRQIAHDLNKRGMRPARDRLWNASTIDGNVSRGGGMILNDLYAGRIGRNKVRMIKDPVTRKRISRPNPKEQYKRVEVSHLRIVDDETFRRAQAVKVDRRRDGTPATAQEARVPKRVFSGLIRCGCCGGGMSSNGAGRKANQLPQQLEALNVRLKSEKAQSGPGREALGPVAPCVIGDSVHFRASTSRRTLPSERVNA